MAFARSPYLEIIMSSPLLLTIGWCTVGGYGLTTFLMLFNSLILRLAWGAVLAVSFFPALKLFTMVVIVLLLRIPSSRVSAVWTLVTFFGLVCCLVYTVYCLLDACESQITFAFLLVVLATMLMLSIVYISYTAVGSFGLRDAYRGD